jgi:hypothetical protein
LNHGRRNLETMQQQTGSAPAPKASSFAGLMAALADPASKRIPAWKDDDLEDDVTTLSYERALQAHARYRPVDAGVAEPKPTPDAGSIRIREVLMAPQLASHMGVPPNPAPSSTRQKGLKCASITIRLSQAECAQLRIRAAEAGLSISAYLRSCTFEAEALRAEVKQTLAQLRMSENPDKPQTSAPAKRSWFHWRTRAETP